MSGKAPNLIWSFIINAILALFLIAGGIVLFGNKYIFHNLFKEEKLKMTPEESNITFGSDLAGGVSAIYEPDLPENFTIEEKKEKLERTVEIIQNRLFRYGDLETDVRIADDNNIHILIPGLQNPQRIIDVLDETGTLEIYLLSYSDDETISKRIAGLNANSPDGLPDSIDLVSALFTEKDFKLLIANTDDISNVRPIISLNGESSVGFDVISEKAQVLMNQIMTQFAGDRVAFVFSGKIKSVVKLQKSEGNGLIGTGYEITAPGGYTQEEIEEYMILLDNRPLPINLTLVRSDYVYPIFGQQAKEKLGLFIAVILVLIAILMGYFYGGGAAIMGIILIFITITLQLAVYAITNLVITLPGLAGLLLVTGMTIDAVILIFEKIKERVYGEYGEASLKASNYPEEGYFSKLRSEIFTSDTKSGGSVLFNTIKVIRITNVIGALAILWYTNGEGPVASFGWALLVGSGLALFICSKHVLLAVYDLSCGIFLSGKKYYNLGFGQKFFTEDSKEGRWYKWVLDRKKIAFRSILLCWLTSILLISFKGFNYGIDFTGGRSIIFSSDSSLFFDQIDELANSELRRSYILNKLRSNEGNLFSLRLNTKISDSMLSDFFNKLGQISEIDIISSSSIGAKLPEDEIWQAFKVALVLLFVIWITSWGFFAYHGLGILNTSINEYYVSIPVFYSVLAVLLDVSLLGGILIVFGLELSASILGVIFLLVGYSINDSLVFIVEMRSKQKFYFQAETSTADKKLETAKEYVNSILMRVISRVFLTSFSTILVLFPLFIMGNNTIRDYSLVIIIGIILGTISSLFFISQLLEKYLEKKPREKKQINFLK